MKRNKFYFSVVLLLIAGISSTFVVGQSNELQRIDQKPRRLRATLPPVTTSSGQEDQGGLIPSYQPQDNSQNGSYGQPSQGNSVSPVRPANAAPGQNPQNSQQLRLASHAAEEGAENMNRPALLTQPQNPGATGIRRAANEPERLPDNNVPASATIRLSANEGNSTGENQHIGTMSVNGNGNWGTRDEVPEHVFQGISQMQEQSQPGTPRSEMQTLVPGMTNPNPLFEQPPAAPQTHQANAPAPFGNPNVPTNTFNNAANQTYQGDPDGVIPFRPIDPSSQADAANNTGNRPSGESRENVRMSFGNPPASNAQATGLPPAPPAFPAGPGAQPAVPAERVARNGSSQIDVHNDGSSLQLGNAAHGATGTNNGEEGTGVPGPGELAGAQIPQLVIQKIMPREVQINEPVTISINIRNTGSSKAKNVVLTDRLPKGARFLEAGASASRIANGDICWQLGDLGINEERTVEMSLVPTVEGEIGSVATATFSVEASASTRVTKPALKMEVSTASDEHLVGGDLILEIVISNPGTGVARNIMIEEFVPEGLSHPKGKKLSTTFGDLKPNENKRLKLTLKCERAGEMINYLVAKGENDLLVESKIPVVVLAPGLSLGIEGPKNRYLERKATYELKVGNPGSATTREVVLVAKLPNGIDFVSTDSMGAYDPETHTVHWMLDTLPSQQSGKIELVTLPREIGEHKIEFVGRAQGNLQAASTHEVSVDGVASLGFEIANKVDPVELGREAVYEIRVFNRGTKASTNVSLNVQLPEDMRFVAAEGPTQHRASGSTIDFGNLFQLAPREEKTYTVRAQCLAAGDQRVVVQVQSDELERPVTKEENTNVYGDE